MQLQHPQLLLALLGLVLMVALYLLLLQWKKNTYKKIGDAALVQQLTADYSKTKFFIKFLLVAAAFTLMAFALASPRKPNGSSAIHRKGIDVMIALDVSRSMLAQDLKPDRLSRAKQFISRLIDKLPDDRIGIVLFAGKAYLQMPLTTDHAAAKMYLSSASTDVVPTQGTVLGDALKMCYTAFNNNEKKYRSVVLITDGEDHDDNAISIAKAMADEGVMINTIGVGSVSGSTIIDPVTNDVKKDAEGNAVITRLNESVLKQIAAAANGIYQPLASADAAATAISSQLKTLGSRAVKDTTSLVYTYYFQWLLALALACIVIEFFLSEKITARRKTLKPAASTLSIAVIILSLLPSTNSFAQKAEALVKKGNHAYAAGQYAAAADSYKKAAAINPKNTKALFNLGNALYKNGKKDEALQAYDEAIANARQPIDQSDTWYNKGVIYQHNNKLPECIDAYKKALRINPADEDARLNLQKALLKQQQQNNNNKQKQQQQQQNQQQKKDNPKPPPAKISKKEAEEKLKALLQHEKNLQDRLRKTDANAPNKPEKDW
jgi:Ca-activated chloride channel homolog